MVPRVGARRCGQPEYPDRPVQTSIVLTEAPAEDPAGGSVGGDGQGEFKIRVYCAGERRSQAILTGEEASPRLGLGRRPERGVREEKAEERMQEAKEMEWCFLHKRSEARSEGVLAGYLLSVGRMGVATS